MTPRRIHAALAVTLSVGALACNDVQLVAEGRLRLDFGLEEPVWSDDGTFELQVDRMLADGSVESHFAAAGPVDAFPMGGGDRARFLLRVVDGSDQIVATGRSVEIDPLAFLGAELPLFVGRRTELARVDELVTDHGEHPPTATIARRYALVAGNVGNEVEPDLFDLARWSTVPGPPRLSCPSPPCAFRSFAVVGPDENVVLGIGDGWAVWLDLGGLTSGVADLPDGLASFADVAGGRTVIGAGGTSYVVGPTRSGEPTDVVLRVSPDGELSALRTSAVRAGAGAAWVDGRGLVVAGGNADAPGIELLAAGAETFEALPYPPDPTEGAGLAALDGASILRIGAGAETATAALGCADACVYHRFADPVALGRAVAFAVEDLSVLVVGDDADGETRARLVDADSAHEISLREPRRGATALRLPTGHVAIVGGLTANGDAARSLELFSP